SGESRSENSGGQGAAAQPVYPQRSVQLHTAWYSGAGVQIRIFAGFARGETTQGVAEESLPRSLRRFEPAGGQGRRGAVQQHHSGFDRTGCRCAGAATMEAGQLLPEVCGAELNAQKVGGSAQPPGDS